MPSELADIQGLPPSPFLVEDDCYDSQIRGVFRQEVPANYLGDGKPLASSPFEKFKPRDCRMENFFDNSKAYLNRGTRGAASYSSMLQSPFANGAQERHDIAMYTPSYFMEGRGLNMTYGVQNENSLFSSSFSDLFTRKMKVSSNNSYGGLFGHSVNGASHQEEEPFEFPEEIEAKTIGSLLPDDDELLSGVTDGLDHLIQTHSGDDLEDLDIFSSIGGMDLGDDISNGNGNLNGDANARSQLGENTNTYAGEHPFGEHPSRTLFVRNINSNVEDSELRALFECYGDIHTLYTTCKHRGFVMISYYDIRSSRSAMDGLQNKPLRRRKLDIHFSIPKDNPSERDTNQGTLVVFNLDSSVTNDELFQIFGAYGDIKEIGPHGNSNKMVEFFDIRAADAAFRALNCSEIAGSRIKLEQSHAGMMQPFPVEMERCGDPGLYLHQTSSSCNSTTGLSGLISHQNLTASGMDNDSLLSVNSNIRSPVSPFLENPLRRGIPSNVSSNGCLPSPIGSIPIVNQPGFEYQGTSPCNIPFHFQPLPDRPDPHTDYSCQPLATLSPNITPLPPSDRMDNGHLCRMSSNTCSLELCEGGFGSPGNGGCPPGHRYMWHNPRPPRSMHMVWPESSPFVNGVCNGHHHPHTRIQALSNGPSHILNAVAPINNCHAGSAPAVNPSLWERRCTYTGESPQTGGFVAGSLGTMRIPKASLHPLDFVPHTMFPRVGGASLDLQISPKNIGFHSPHQRGMMFPGRGQIMPMMSPFDSPNDRGRCRRNEANSNHGDNKKQYDLDLDRIVQGEDCRTTLMIKNIPNKYTSKMLLATIDERHRGMYDFLYLPIDFKNKCNVGYAFINMTEPCQIIPFYQAFNGKKWEKFNSEKVASLAYARIQGKPALIAHFQNSSLMNEDKRCRPILFNTDGPNAGDQVPFPIGVNVRPRAGRCGRNGGEDNSADSLGMVNGDNREECSSGNSKESSD